MLCEIDAHVHDDVAVAIAFVVETETNPSDQRRTLDVTPGRRKVQIVERKRIDDKQNAICPYPAAVADAVSHAGVRNQ